MPQSRGEGGREGRICGMEKLPADPGEFQRRQQLPQSRPCPAGNDPGTARAAPGVFSEPLPEFSSAAPALLAPLERRSELIRNSRIFPAVENRRWSWRCLHRSRQRAEAALTPGSGRPDPGIVAVPAGCGREGVEPSQGKLSRKIPGIGADHAERQGPAAPRPSSARELPGARDPLRVPPAPELCPRVPAQPLPHEQRDAQRLDTPGARRVPAVAAGGTPGRGGRGRGAVPGVPGHVRAVPAGLGRCPRLGRAGHARAAPRLLLRLRRAQPLRPGFLEAERPCLSKASRTLAFVYPYIFDSIPIFYRLSRSAAGSCSEASLPLHSRHSLCALLTFLSFTSRLPERLAPGSFDFIGHSHQVFHVCGILGTLFQLEAVSVDMAERRGRLPLPSSLETFGSLGMGAAASLAILGICFRSLRPEPLPREKSH
ncbi:membrane progestin receptor gamma isoform X1 [Prinia subflava]|uniref:membrane progestin receptor gamma isoform X1 n=1 Tax=Prinia subflava TaxID=208062 RepID=UPI002FDFCB1D